MKDIRVKQAAVKPTMKAHHRIVTTAELVMIDKEREVATIGGGTGLNHDKENEEKAS